MKLREAATPAQVDVAYLAAKHTFMSQSLVCAVPASARALRHALQPMSILYGRVCVPLACCSLHASRPLVVSYQLLC